MKYIALNIKFNFMDGFWKVWTKTCLKENEKEKKKIKVNKLFLHVFQIHFIYFLNYINFMINQT